MRIETPRLVIRSFGEDDVRDYASIVAEPTVTRYIGDGSPHSYQEAEAYVHDAIRRDRESGVSRYAVVRKAEGDLIGFCGFKELDDYIDFGWRYSQRVWRRGYGTEAARAVLDYGISTLRLESITAVSFVRNVGSVRIIEKLGGCRLDSGEIRGEQTVRYCWTSSA